MNLISILIFYLFASFQIFRQALGHQYGHACQHDAYELERVMPKEYYEETLKEMGKERRLGAASPQPFRVSVDYTQLDNPANGSGMDQTKKDYIIKIMKASQLFLQNFIKVIPRTKPIIKRGSANCIDMNVPTILQSTGISDSDLHILVTFENNIGSSGLANAGACDYDPNPIVGRIKFNIGTMKNIGTTPDGFESDFSTAIHELTHVLGFSGGAMQYWIDPDTGLPYLSNVSKIKIIDEVRNVTNVVKLKSKNVLETARRYFNCPSLDSVPLENQGGPGSFGSHWERDLIQNEYMTASAILGHAVISEFTAALLIDTGFYAEINVNMVEKTYWGRGKGCDFITLSCANPNIKYPEFTFDILDKCDYYSMGYGPPSSDQFSQCKITQSYSNTKCYDTLLNKPNAVRRNNSGANSKCFSSTAFDTGYVYKPENDSGSRCHKYTCNSDNTVINVSLWQDPSKGIDIKAICNTPNQVIDLATSITMGKLTCPQDFNLFCNFPKSCNNFCSGNGICSNAVCYCLEGFVGEDCSKTCPVPQVWDGTQCVLNCGTGTYLNPDKTCKPTCPKSYFQNTNSNTCNLCDKTCSSCNDGTSTNCTECNSPYTLSGTSCIDPSKATIVCNLTCLTCSGTADNQCLTCAEGRFLDSQNKCTLCTSPCKSCVDSATKCTACMTNYTYSSTNNTCAPICDSSCLTCSSPKDATQCQSCNIGYYLSSGQCLQCTSPCATCIDSTTKCQSCVSNFTYDSSTNKCNPKCDVSCLTCSTPVDATKCLSCKDGFYISSGKCLTCASPCSKCNSLATTCTECIADYTYNSSNNSCVPICHASCKTCTVPKNAQKCSSCNDGFYLDSTTLECKQCSSPCATCSNSATSCLSCISLTDYTYDSSSKVCNMICHSSCKTCTKPNDTLSCSSCIDGKYLDTNQCKVCTSPCKTCQTTATTCTACELNYNLNSNTCNPSCDSTCKTCTKPLDANACSGCYDGRFLDGTKCTLCTNPCSKCQGSATKCIDCISTDYALDSPNYKCNPICDTTCKTCTKPKDSNSCLTCNDGKFLEGTKCTLCTSPCLTCDTNTTKCLSCIANFTYDNTQNICNPNCDTTCKTCTKPNDANACSSCNNGRFLDGTKCTLCTSPCLTCDTNTTKCLSCITNYSYDNTKNICNPTCDSTCKTCTKPNDANSCSSCSDGLFLDGTKCTVCISPCSKCQDTNQKCTGCISVDYTLDLVNFKCIPICDGSCRTCNKPKDAAACLTCNDGYFLTAGQCKKCDSPCQTCDTSSTKCLSCVANYTYDNTKNICNPLCDASCKSCTKPIDANSCSSCNDGSFLDGTKCTKCASPCQNCQDQSIKCTTCITDFSLEGITNKCNPVCDLTCKSCTLPKDPTKCQDCQDGSYLSSGQCKKCTSPCKTCVDSDSKCLTCISSDYTLNSLVNKCQPICDSSCKTCSAPKDVTKCTTCLDGKYLNNGQCLPCKSPCASCDTSDTKCLTCVTNFTFNSSTNTCLADCDSSCKTCSAAKDPNACQSCKDGYFLSGTQCLLCSNPCKTCIDNPTKCLSCTTDTDYTYDSPNKQCNPICDSSCLTCSEPRNPLKCSSCSDGTYLDSNQCKKCQAPCQTCNKLATNCLTCINSKYTHDPLNNTCKSSCHSSCQSCTQPDDANSCDSCFDGFFLNGSSCQLCTSPCQTCQTNSTTCKSCETGYSYNSSSNTCSIICEKQCKTCTKPYDIKSCQSCIDGYFLNGTECQTCQSPCQNCVDTASKCLSCISSVDYEFKLSTNKCELICHSTCKTCTEPNNPTKCKDCPDGSFLINGECRKCTSPCGNCESNPAKCLSCISADYNLEISTNSCNPTCDSSCKTCSSPKDSSKCISCQDGYYFNNGYCKKCTSPCQKCIDIDTKCTECIDPAKFKFDGPNNKCMPLCHQTCKDCSSPQDDSKCTSCNDGSYLESGYCKKCEFPCATCKNSSYCSTCEAGYKPDINGKCIPQCHTSCLTCSKPNDANTCLTCQVGFFLNNFSQCLQCTSPCKSCVDSADKCTTCINDYNLDSSLSVCTPICDSSCKTCSEPKNLSKCLSCVDGSFLNSNTCQKCQQPCLTCQNSATQCLSCINSNYTYEKSQFKCTSNCDSSCKTCNGSTQTNCISCYDSFFLDTSSNRCKPCASPCDNCTKTQDNCISCKNGYTLNVNKCIQSCHSSCKTCNIPNDLNSCTSCQDGQFLNNGQCTQCFSPCATCSQTATKCLSCKANYTLNSVSNSCSPTCHSSCATCSAPNDAYTCISCPQGRYLEGKQCQLCPENCAKCANSQICQSCKSNFLLDQTSGKCQAVCHYSCLSCSLANNPNACLTCPPNKILQNGTCNNCPDGTFFNSNQCSNCQSECKTCSNASTCLNCKEGFYLDSNTKCQQNQVNYQCHYTCKSCVGASYSHCTSCQGNRVLSQKSTSVNSSKLIGTCDCPVGTSDVNKSSCDATKIQETIKTTTTAFLISSGTTTTILSVASSNPLVLASLIEFSQTISFFTYVNEKPALGFDNVAQNLYVSHITKIFNFGSISNSKSSRILQSISQQNLGEQGQQGFTNNSKIPLNDKYPQFVVNALSIIVLTGFIWLLSALSTAITIKDSNSFSAKIKKIFCISLPLCIFVLTSQEFCLLIFFQFQQLSLEEPADVASAFLSFLIFFYILSFLGYLFYKLEYKKSLTKPMNFTSSIMQTNAKVHPVFGVEDNNPTSKVENTITNMDYYTFYIIHLYIRQNSFLNRAFVQIMVVRKMITALIMTYGFKEPVSQMGVLFGLYLVYWLYIILSKPFKEIKHRIVYTMIETITLIMHLLYLILLSNDSNQEQQKNISLVMLVLIMITLLIYLLISFFYLAIFLLQILKKCGQKNVDDVVVNVSQHFGQNQSSAKLQEEESPESKNYIKPVDTSYNPNQISLIKQTSVLQDKINSGVIQNNSLYQDNQGIQNSSKSHIQDTLYMESPQRLKQQQQQQQSGKYPHVIDFQYIQNQNRQIQGQTGDKFKPQDDLLPEVISRHIVPQIFIDDVKSPPEQTNLKNKKFTDIY